MTLFLWFWMSVSSLFAFVCVPLGIALLWAGNYMPGVSILLSGLMGVAIVVLLREALKLVSES